MIIEFSVKNFRSIKDLQTISFAATKLDSNQEKYPDVDKNNVVIEGGMKLLKTVGIYGANASGKSNILKAFDYFIQAIKAEPSPESNLNSLCDPFLFQENSSESESLFQVILFLKGKKYRYGFTVKLNPKADDSNKTITKSSKEIITNEWLYGTKEKNSGEYFIREGRNVNKEKLPNKDQIAPLPYEHTLFLTHVAAFDGEGICATIRAFFRNLVVSNYSIGIERYRKNSVSLLMEDETKHDFLGLFSSFDLNYEDAIIEQDDETKKMPVFPQNKIFLTKKYLSSNGDLLDIKLNLSTNESSGTQKLFDLAGLLLRAFKVPGTPFLILDELDSNFHPSLLVKLIGVFNNPEINKNNTQLLFSSHDTNLMSPSLLRRDQFYFTEKDIDNSTRLFSLAELKGIRNDADFARQYLAGFYGALPVINDIVKNQSTEND